MSDTVPEWMFHWNPRKPVIPGRLGRRIPWRRKVNNFGDLIGPRIVRLMMTKRSQGASASMPDGRRLFSVGSVLHFAKDGDVVWGSGINGKISTEKLQFSALDIRAVRGPRTAAVLRGRGLRVPEIFGDPALLLPELDHRFAAWSAEKTVSITIVPNLNDIAEFRGRPDVLDPRSPLDVCLERIARSEVIVASSLHGIILGEVAGARVVPFLSGHEALFKYDDYYEGTGRARPEFAPDVHTALSRVRRPGSTPETLRRWAPGPLMGAFPWDALSGASQ